MCVLLAERHRDHKCAHETTCCFCTITDSIHPRELSVNAAIRTAILCVGTVFLSGCQKANDTITQFSGEAERSCSSPSATGIIGQIFGEGTEARAREENKNMDEAQRLDLAKVRALAGEVQYELLDVVTTKKDPDSTKRFCEAELKIGIPDGTLHGANLARKSRDLASIQSIAEDANFKTDLNKFRIKIAYNVQPTDDGKKIYVGLENSQPIQLLVSETVLWAVVGAKQGEVRTSSVQQAIPVAPPVVGTAEVMDPPTPPSLPAPPQATTPVNQALADSTAQFMALEREINVVWKSLPKDIRDANLEAQRTFNREKELVCMREANTAGGNFEMVRNQCWSRFYQQRIPQLKSLI